MELNEQAVCENVELHLGDEQRKKLVDSLPNEEVLDKTAEFFKIFGDQSRIKIMHLLSNYEMCVCDIANTLNMTQSAISHQLRMLKAHRLVKYRREGKSIYYSLDDHHIKMILDQGIEHISHK